MTSVDIDAILAAVETPRPWTVEALCESVARLRKRPIQLLVRPAEVQDQIYATVIASKAADYIFVRSDLVGFHRDQAVCHELGHLLAGHMSTVEPPAGPSTDGAAGLSSQLLSHLFNRSSDGYSDDKEAQAELIGARLLTLGARAGAETDSIARGLGDALR